MYTTANMQEFAQALSNHRPTEVESGAGTTHAVEYIEGSDGEVARIIMGDAFEGVDAILSNGSTGTLAYLSINLPEPTEFEDADEGEES